MREYLMVGTVLKPQGVRGECKIRSCAAEIGRFQEWKTLYLEEDGRFTALPCRVTRIRDDFVFAVLGACSTPEDVEKLRGRELYIDREHAAPAEENGNYIVDLIGCEAADEAGRLLGVLTDVLQHGPVDTWVFRGDRGVWMAPALLKVFPDVNTVEKRITVDSVRLREVAVFED